MNVRAWRVLAPIIALAPSAIAGGPASTAEPHKKVLVELHPARAGEASGLLGQLAAIGHGVDHVVAITFPGDDPAFALRRRDYVESRRLEAPPASSLLMIDGRQAVVGEDRAKAEEALRSALKEAPGVELVADLGGSGSRRALVVKVSARAASLAGRDLTVAVALTEDRTTTDSTSGEHAGWTIVEHHVARRFDRKAIRLDRAGSKALTFSLELPERGDPGRFRVAIFVQDHPGGKVHQAESLPWLAALEPEHAHHQPPARKKSKRPTFNIANPFGPMPGMTGQGQAESSEDVSVLCPNCGSTYTIPGLLVQPNGPKLSRGGTAAPVPLVPC